MALINGSIPVTGFIAPTDTTDTYAVTDAIYGIDGLRNVPTHTDMYNIPLERRRSGMIVGVISDNTYWRLLPSTGSNIWNIGSASNWEEFTVSEGLFKSGSIIGISYSFVAQVMSGAGLTSNGGVFDIVAGSGITVSADLVSVDYTSVAQVMSGAGLTSNGGVFDIVAGSGITVSADLVSVDYTSVAQVMSGAGLTSNGSSIDVNVSNGLTIINDTVQVSPNIAGLGLTFSSGVLSVIAGNSQPQYQIGLTTSVSTGETGIFLSETPNEYSRIQVFVNGQLQTLGDGETSKDCHFGTTNSAILLSSLSSGNQLVWNAANAGFTLSPTDKIDIIYES
jgi:hypothetical protein